MEDKDQYLLLSEDGHLYWTGDDIVLQTYHDGTEEIWETGNCKLCEIRFFKEIQSLIIDDYIACIKCRTMTGNATVELEDIGL